MQLIMHSEGVKFQQKTEGCHIQILLPLWSAASGLTFPALPVNVGKSISGFVNVLKKKEKKKEERKRNTLFLILHFLSLLPYC